MYTVISFLKTNFDDNVQIFYGSDFVAKSASNALIVVVGVEIFDIMVLLTKLHAA